MEWILSGVIRRRRLAGRNAKLTTLAVSPDGKVIAAANDNAKQIVLWDNVTWRERWPEGVEKGALTSLCYTGAKTVMTIRDEKWVRFWDALSGKCLRHLTPELAFGRILAVSPSGDRLAGVSDDNRVGVCDAITGKIRWQSTTPTPALIRLVFSPDGRTLLATAGPQDAPHLVRWDAATGMGASNLGSPPGCRTLLFCPDGAIVGVAAEGRSEIRSRLFQLGRGHKWRPLAARIHLSKDGGDALALSPDGRLLLVKTAESHSLRASRLALFETVSGGFAGWLRSAMDKDDFPVRDAAFSPDGKWLASTHSDGSVRLWDMVTWKEIERFSADEGTSRLVAISPDGMTLASARFDGTILVWPARSLLDLNYLWRDLASDQAEAGQRAIAKLVASPRQSVLYVEKHLPPLPKGDTRRLRQLVADLDSDSYEVRQQAAEDLEKEHEAAEDALQEALKGNPSLELRRRVSELLEKLEETRREISSEDRRVIRAVQVLETIATLEAQQVLRRLSEGASGALRTKEARAALRRLERKTTK